MSHIITYTEEIEDHVFCQRRPALETGEKYLLEIGERVLNDRRAEEQLWGPYVGQWLGGAHCN